MNRKQTPTQPKTKKPKSAGRSEELDDIIDRMPMAFGKWVALSVIIFAALFLLFGWIIKYPDMVTGQIKINALNPTIRLVANSTGNLLLLSQKAQEEVKKGEYIAVIQNPASIEDMQKIANLLEIVNFENTPLPALRDTFPDKVSLGEINPQYYAFLAALKAQCDYRRQNVYEKQKENILTGIEWKKKIIQEAENSQKAANDRMEVAHKWLDRYVSLDKKEIATYEYETDQMKNNYLSTLQDVQNINREITSARMQITEAYHQLGQLEIEQKEKERNLNVELLSTYQNLKANITAWEQKYTFKAPFDGKVEFLKFIADGQFVQAGDAIFGIIPKENHVYGQVLLPANGAGKVKPNSKVVIKLENYPYMEYGYIEGYVSSISLVTQTQKTAESTIETYLINVELPNGLKTNYEENLDFKYELGGTADIIVKDRRLIERLFDNLRYRTK